MRIFTVAGDMGMLWIALTIYMLFTKKYRQTGIIMAAGLVIVLLTGNIMIKNLVARDRPFIQHSGFILSIAPPSGYSFPSSHSFSSFTSAAILTRRGKLWALFSIPTAVFIAFSRLYFYVHFPTDVVCGMLLGIFTGTIVYEMFRKYVFERPLNDEKQD